MGASKDILLEAKPHIGTDKLRKIVVNIRKNLIDMGSRIEFRSQVTDFLIRQGQIEGVIVNEKEKFRPVTSFWLSARVLMIHMQNF